MHLKELPNFTSPYFTEDTILNILSTKFNLNNSRVEDVKLGAPSKKGDSYLSNIIRFTITAAGVVGDSGEEKKVTLPIICKTLPKNIVHRKTFRITDFFRNETTFYNKVWPAMQKFVSSKDDGAGVFGEIPLCFSAYADGEHDYIALEDLSYKGYQGVLRGDCLDFDHTIISLKLFAKFHAIALAFKDQSPEEFEAVANSLQETYFAERFRSWYSNFQKFIFKIILDAVEKQLPNKYLRQLELLLDNDFYGKLVEQCKNTGQLSVITHADAWIPNFLMKYDANSKPIDIMLIDFQLARYATLGNDLMFFFYACTDQRLRELHWDTFLHEYHKTFTDTLSALGSDKNLLTMDALKADIKQKAVFGIGMAIEAVTMSLLEDDEVADTDSIQGNQAVPLESVWVVHPFKSEEKRQRLADIIKHAVDNDFI